MAFLLNGQPLAVDTPFKTPDGTQYPANWLRLSSAEEKTAIGITEVPDPTSYDERFYWGYDAEGHLIPKDHNQLVDQWMEQTRVTAGTLLAPNDWMVVRELDNGTPVDPAWKTWREATRTAAAEKIIHIGTTNDTDELAAYINSANYWVWPADPNAYPETPEAFDTVIPTDLEVEAE